MCGDGSLAAAPHSRNGVRTIRHVDVSVESGVTDAGGVVEPIAGTTDDDPGFDAALLLIRP